MLACVHSLPAYWLSSWRDWQWQCLKLWCCELTACAAPGLMWVSLARRSKAVVWLFTVLSPALSDCCGSV